MQLSNIKQHQGGFTLFEFAVGMIVLGILLGTLLERLAYYEGEAERANVLQLVGNLRTGLNSRLYAVHTRGETVSASALATENPMSWLQKIPPNYRGEIGDVTAADLQPGNWYFSPREHKLVYVFIGKKSFHGDSFERWYFKVEFGRLPTKNAKPDGAPDVNNGVALIQVDG